MGWRIEQRKFPEDIVVTARRRNYELLHCRFTAGSVGALGSVRALSVSPLDSLLRHTNIIQRVLNYQQKRGLGVVQKAI